MANWDEFFAKEQAPANLKEVKSTISAFAASHRSAGRDIVFVTVSFQLLLSTFA